MKRMINSLAGLTILFSLGSFLRVNGTLQAKSGNKEMRITADTAQEPRMTIEEISVPEQIVVYVTDSAAAVQRSVRSLRKYCRSNWADF